MSQKDNISSRLKARNLKGRIKMLPAGAPEMDSAHLGTSADLLINWLISCQRNTLKSSFQLVWNIRNMIFIGNLYWTRIKAFSPNTWVTQLNSVLCNFSQIGTRKHTSVTQIEEVNSMKVCYQVYYRGLNYIRR